MEGIGAFDMKQPEHRRALELIGENLNCGLLLCAEGGENATLYVNERFARYLGYGRDEFMARFPRYIASVSEDDRAYVQTTIAMALDQRDEYDLIYRMRRRDGGVVWIRENGRRVISPRGERQILSTMADITSDMAARQEIETQSKADPLTHVLNRTAFREQMEALLRATPMSERRHALIDVDVDHFGHINEVFGHGFGDKVIQDVATSLRAVIRAGDILGRMGGDEFMLCLKDIRVDDSFRRRMEHISGILRKQLPADIDLTCSLGVAIYCQSGEKFGDLQRRASQALAKAKRLGGDKVAFFDSQMEAQRPEDGSSAAT